MVPFKSSLVSKRVYRATRSSSHDDPTGFAFKPRKIPGSSVFFLLVRSEAENFIKARSVREISDSMKRPFDRLIPWRCNADNPALLISCSNLPGTRVAIGARRCIMLVAKRIATIIATPTLFLLDFTSLSCSFEAQRCSRDPENLTVHEPVQHYWREEPISLLQFCFPFFFSV